MVACVELRDGSVVLREWREEDATTVFDACQDPEILRWMPIIPRPYTMDDALAFVRDEIGLGPHQFAVVLDGRVVGSTGLRVGQSLTGEIGYWCAAAVRGRGVIPRAARLICGYAFESLGLERLQITADPENLASQRVAEKLGFRREGVLRSHLRHPDGRRRDSVMFSLLPGELREESGAQGRNG
jgi:RimJ/RimL family protein N-acetyltransferase